MSAPAPGRHRAPSRDEARTVLFEAWRGRYSDSPRAVSELLSASAPAVTASWVAAPTTRTPAGVRRVRRYGVRHLHRLATCDHLVTNDIITRPVPVSPRAVYIQTWHGSPLKTVGLHERDPVYAGAAGHRRRMLRDVRRWTHLVSPSPRYTEIFRGAFGYEGSVLEIGNPRNDLLVRGDPARRQRVRAALGLAADQRALLYAPTWREDSQDPAGRFRHPELIDWRELRALLPADVVLLTRLHANVRPSPPAAPDDRVRDVNGHGDVAELLLAADGLITDYSSIVHDFVLTGRPVYLHAPDLDRYRESVRALYVDYETWAPGPISRSTEELAHHIGDVVDVEPDRRASFLADYCTFEDGHATERLVALILGAAPGSAS